MTTAIAPTPFPTSAAGQWTCTIEDGRRPRTVTMRRYLVDEHAVVFRADGWTYRVDAIEISDQGDVYITLIRRTRKGHDYKNRLGISTSLADLATSPSTAPRHLAGIVARLQATVAALAPAPAPVTVPMPQARPGECPDCLAPEGECSAATCPAYASDDAPDTGALAPDAPLGTIRFHEGSEDAPQCPCGNDVQGEGFRHVTVAATADDGWVGVFIEPDGAWHALGRHVACLRDYCLRVWSDRDIVTDGTGTWAPVTMRLHHVAEPVQS